MSSPLRPTSEPIACCGECGAERQSDKVTCESFGISFIDTASPRPTFDVPRHSYSLSSLFLLISLASVLLAIGSVLPCAGIPLTMFAMISWFRASNAVRDRAVHGRASSTSDKIYLFLRALLTSLAIICLLGLIVFLGFWVGGIAYVACMALGMLLNSPEWFFHPIALVIAIVTALWVAVPAFRWLDKSTRTTFRVEDRVTLR